jgi:hypothetical protein
VVVEPFAVGGRREELCHSPSREEIANLEREFREMGRAI